MFCFVVLGLFLFCDDLFGWWFLCCGVWIVFLLVVVGNGIVLFVFIMVWFKLFMDVFRFLICNLVCVDFMMGVYFGILVIFDVLILGMIFFFCNIIIYVIDLVVFNWKWKYL